MNNFFTLFIALLINVSLSAQGFITPVDEVPHSNEGYIIQTDGTRLDGTIKSYEMTEGIKAVTMVDNTGVKLKIVAANIKELGVKSTGVVKMELMAESTETVKKFTKADFDEIAKKREYIIY